MWLPAILHLLTASASAQEIDPLPRGSWRPIAVYLAQEASQAGGWTRPQIIVSLQFDHETPVPDLETEDEVRQFCWRRWWMLDCTVDVQLFAGQTELRYYNSSPVGSKWPIGLHFQPAGVPGDGLELILSRHDFTQQAFVGRVTVPGDGAELRVGQLPFVFQRIEEGRYPPVYLEDMPDFRWGLPICARYATPGPPLERMSKLLFRLSADADPDLMPYWFYRITAFLGDEQVVARYAAMTPSTEPGVAWLGVWLPTTPEELPATFDLEIVGEHLIVDEEVAEESIFDLPMPALLP